MLTFTAPDRIGSAGTQISKSRAMVTDRDKKHTGGEIQLKAGRHASEEKRQDTSRPGLSTSSKNKCGFIVIFPISPIWAIATIATNSN